MKQINIPTKAGYYWAKSSNYEFYNYIVEVRGEIPFFRMMAWDLRDNKIVELRDWEIDEFGTEIPCPEFKR